MNRFMVVAMLLMALALCGPVWGQSSKDHDWAHSEAQAPPVQDVRGSGYWWWPSQAKSNVEDGETWGNRGVVFDQFMPPPPPPPRMPETDTQVAEVFQPEANPQPMLAPVSEPEPATEPEQPTVNIFGDERFIAEEEPEPVQMARAPEPIDDGPSVVIPEPEPEQPAVDIFADERFLRDEAAEPVEEMQIAKAPEPVDEAPRPVVPEPEPEQPAVNIFSDPRFLEPREEPVQIAEAVPEDESAPIPTRMIPVFENVLFAFDQAKLKPEGMKLIRKVVVMLDEYAHDTLVIEGHTDNINRSGDPQYNVKLGQRRASEVMKALVAEGIDPSRLKAVSMGDGNPAVANDSEANRSLNRRVVFKYSLSD